MIGFVRVTPHKSPVDFGRPGPLGPMKTVRPSGGKVRIGFGDGTRVLGHRSVSLAPVFDPLAISMTPILGWSVDAAIAA